jgi:peptide/nickel transport system substrate-binding protein
MRRIPAAGVLSVVAALLLVSSGGTHAVKEGGTFRVASLTGRVKTIDPQLVGSVQEAQLLDPACATLVAFPDKPLPGGFRLTPSLAQAEPVVSRDGRTYTFTIRKDARFSTGAPVTAQAIVRAIERLLDPAMLGLTDLAALIVGGDDVLAGKTKTPSGAIARGRTLTLKLTRREPTFLPNWVSGFCAVPPNLPADAEGAKAPLPSPAPYYVAEYLPGERLVLERNRFYRGERPQHVARFVADLAADFPLVIDQVASGTFDTLVGQCCAERTADLAQKYGVNKSQLWVVPSSGLRMFHLNTSRPLFRNNVKLRQAVNFAVDRKAFAREAGFLANTPTDQYLLPGSPGYRDERIYPLKGPNVEKAQALARGHTRGGKAVLYTLDNLIDSAQAQILQQNLRAIGLELEIKQFPNPLFFQKITTRGEPFDLARVQWIRPDLNCLFNGRTIGQPTSCNISHFNSPKYNRLLDRASRLTGEARDRAYGELDVQLSRDAAPATPVAVNNSIAFVSARVGVGCVVMNPSLDLTAVCLK